ncbi:MAG: sensor domain-containing diguanylate cyclase [Fretibacterium sp.]|nr:sensor domain-containing diguanylate cyclase [Fretibacterium sp.]
MKETPYETQKTASEPPEGPCKRAFAYFLSLIMDPVPIPSPDCLTESSEAAELEDALTLLRTAIEQAQLGNFSYPIPFQGALPQALKAMQLKMKQIMTMVQRIAEGNMDQCLGFEGPLAQLFNGMAESLASLVSELNNRQFELEAIREQLEYEGYLRELAEFKLKEEAERWRLALECGQDGLWDIDLIDPDKPPFFSQKFLELIKVSDPEDLPPINLWFDYVHPEDMVAANPLRDALNGETPEERFCVELRMRCGDGTHRWFHLEGFVFRDSDSNSPARTIGLITDIQERKEKEALISHKATHDALTGLPNRALFNEKLNNLVMAAQQRGTFLAIVMMDLDKFKQVNDTLGHHAGDLLLIEVGKRLSSSTRESDVVARLGGDEFAMLLPFKAGCKKTISVSLERIMEALRQTVMLETVEYKITASLGVAVYPTDGSDPVELLKRADEALYWAKNAGRNEYAFWDPNAPAQKDEEAL